MKKNQDSKLRVVYLNFNLKGKSVYSNVDRYKLTSLPGNMRYLINLEDLYISDKYLDDRARKLIDMMKNVFNII